MEEMEDENNFVDPHVGMEFDSCESMLNYMDEFQEYRREVYTKKNSRYLDENDPAYVRFQYYEIAYHCIHGGAQYRRNSQQIRQSKTLKVNCPAFIKFRITKDKQHMSIVKIFREHKNHLPSAPFYKFYAKNRRLNPEQTKAVDEWLMLQVSKPRIRQKIATEFGKKSRLFDLYNQAAKLKTGQENDLFAAVEFLMNKGATVSIGVDENTFKGIYFSTEDMRQSMKAYPEIVFIDATYKLIDTDLKLLLAIVEDSNGASNIVAVGLLISETIATVHWFFETFRKDHSRGCEKIRCFMADKDSVYRRVLKELFGENVPVYICMFHTLQAMKRKYASIKLKQQEQEALMTHMKKLAYSSCQQEYETHYEYFCRNFPADVVDYYNKNWHPIRAEWTIFSMHNGNLLNTTNNRLECQNQKIKSIADKNQSLLAFLRDFFTYLLTKDMEVDSNASENYVKIATGFQCDSDEEKYLHVLTTFAFSYVHNEMAKHKTIKIETDECSKCAVVRRKYNTLNVSVDSCECLIVASLMLPCRHIFALRKYLGMPLFDPNLCNHRWTKHYYSQTQRLFASSVTMSLPSKPLSLVVQLAITGTATSEGRKSTIIPLMEFLLNTVSRACGSQFFTGLVTLEAIKKFWQEGHDVVLKKIDEQSFAGLDKIENLTLNSDKKLLDGKKNETVQQKMKKVKPVIGALIEICLLLKEEKALQKKIETLVLLKDLWSKAMVEVVVSNDCTGISINKITFDSSEALNKIQSNSPENDKNRLKKIIMPTKVPCVGHPSGNLITTPRITGGKVAKPRKKKEQLTKGILTEPTTKVIPMAKGTPSIAVTVRAGITAAEKTAIVSSEGDDSVQERAESSGNVKVAPRPGKMPAGITAAEKTAIVSSEGDGSVQERVKSSGHVKIAPRPAQKSVEVPAGITAAEKTAIVLSEGDDSVQERAEASGNVKNAPRPAPRLGKMPDGITAAEKTIGVPSEGDGSVQKRVESSGHVKIAPRPAQKPVEVPAGIVASEKTIVASSEEGGSVHGRVEASGNVKNAPRPAQKSVEVPAGIVAAEKTIVASSEGDGSVQERAESSGNVIIASRPAQKPVEVPAGIVAAEKTIVASSEEGGSVHGRVEAAENVKKAPKTIVAKFNEKTQNEQINLLLEWLKIPNVVNIMEGLAKLKESDIKHLDAYTLSDALLSDEVNITCLQKYCTAGALRAIKKYIKQKNKINEWHCGQCSNTIETAMIMCDSCLLWQHYDCVNLKEGEEIDGEWYCPRCLFNI